MGRMALYIMGPLPFKKENNYIFVVGDYFIKWMAVFPIKNEKDKTIAQVLIERIRPS